MKKNILILLCILIVGFVFSQQNIKDAKGNSLAYIKNNILLDSSHQVLYNYKGFILFNKLFDDKENIVLTLDIRKNKTAIFKNIETSASWIIKNNTIFWKKNREDIKIIKLRKEDDFTSFYNAHNDSLVAYIDTENISNLNLSILFFHVWNVLNLEEKFTQSFEKVFSQTTDLPEGILASMKPIFGDKQNIWLWDGKYFFPAYDKDKRFVWQYDGEILKPILFSKMENEWSWDGDELKPYWGGHPRNNWRWQNGIFSQIFENNYKNEYEIVDNTVRKRFSSFGDNEWEIEGEMPLPIIGLILLGVIYR